MKVLAAVAPDSVVFIKEALGASFTIEFADSVKHARELLANGDHAAIVCGSRFDESRLLELLTYCKASPTLSAIPFLCVRVLPGRLTEEAYREMARVAQTMGAAGYIDLCHWTETHSATAAQGLLRDVLTQLVRNQLPGSDE
jgi:hypothetical protein